MDDFSNYVDGPMFEERERHKIIEEICRVDGVELPEELLDAFAYTFTEYLRVVMRAATYLFGDNPTPEQCRAGIWLMEARSQELLEDKWGGPLP